MDISNLVFGVLCCFLPYCTIMAVIAIIGTRAKYKSATRILKDLEKDSQKSLDQLPLNNLIKIYILIACAFLALILVGLTLVAIFYFSPSAALKMDANILWIIVSIFMIAGMLTSGILIVILTIPSSKLG